MKIKNTSSKIINIGATVLMPDADMPADELMCSAPAIKALVEMGLLQVGEDEKEKAEREEAEAKVKAEAEAKAKAEAEAKAKAEAEAKAKAKAAAEAAKAAEQK